MTFYVIAHSQNDALVQIRENYQVFTQEFAKADLKNWPPKCKIYRVTIEELDR